MSGLLPTTTEWRTFESGRNVPLAAVVTYQLMFWRPACTSQAALAMFHRAETEKWWPVIKTANIRVQ
jgi:hypothetical protein